MVDSKDKMDYLCKIRKIKQDIVKVTFDYQHELKHDDRTK